MGSKGKQSQADSIHDALLGYATVVLSIACFILALIVLVVAVRFVVGLGAGSSTTATTATTTVTATTTHGSRT